MVLWSQRHYVKIFPTAIKEGKHPKAMQKLYCKLNNLRKCIFIFEFLK